MWGDDVAMFAYGDSPPSKVLLSVYRDDIMRLNEHLLIRPNVAQEDMIESICIPVPSDNSFHDVEPRMEAW